LNLNNHHHAVVPDGVFTTGEDAPRFEKQAAPKLEELARVLARIVKRTRQMLSRRGLRA
jgi:hypothetical protein